MPRSGSPGWMAPEQLTRGETTPACDIFAWGILVAYAAAGSHPFGPSTAIEHRIIHAEPDLQPVPERLRPLVSRALHKDPDTRLTVTQLAEQTAGLLGPAGTVVLPTVAYTRQASPATTEETTLAHNLPWTLSAPGSTSPEPSLRKGRGLAQRAGGTRVPRRRHSHPVSPPRDADTGQPSSR